MQCGSGGCWISGVIRCGSGKSCVNSTLFFMPRPPCRRRFPDGPGRPAHNRRSPARVWGQILSFDISHVEPRRSRLAPSPIPRPTARKPAPPRPRHPQNTTPTPVSPEPSAPSANSSPPKAPASSATGGQEVELHDCLFHLCFKAVRGHAPRWCRWMQPVFPRPAPGVPILFCPWREGLLRFPR